MAERVELRVGARDVWWALAVAWRGVQSDVWALGCVLYELTTLNHAFDASNMCALVLAILRGKYPPIDVRYSPELRRLVSKMLQAQVCVCVFCAHGCAFACSCVCGGVAACARGRVHSRFRI